VVNRRRTEAPGAQLLKATAPVIALGLIAVASVFVVASEQPSAVSVRAQAGSWGSDHPRLKIAKGTSKLDWGGAEEYMADDAAKIATNQANVFDPQYGQTPPPINKGYLDEIEQAQGEQAQEVVDNAAIAMGEEVKGATYYTNETYWREGPPTGYNNYAYYMSH